jgi:hypothetical protein
MYQFYDECVSVLWQIGECMSLLWQIWEYVSVLWQICGCVSLMCLSSMMNMRMCVSAETNMRMCICTNVAQHCYKNLSSIFLKTLGVMYGTTKLFTIRTTFSHSAHTSSHINRADILPPHFEAKVTPGLRKCLLSTRFPKQYFVGIFNAVLMYVLC